MIKDTPAPQLVNLNGRPVIALDVAAAAHPLAHLSNRSCVDCGGPVKYVMYELPGTVVSNAFQPPIWLWCGDCDIGG